jgi:Uma2 family endonuclease
MRGSQAGKVAEVEYPSSDGKPMAETDLHRDWMYIIIHRLQRFFAGRRVYVSGNLLIYYEEGDPRKCVAPDAFVVKNCKPGRRETFRIWQEGRTPHFVLETTSKTTRREDAGKKNKIYAELGIPEYFLYDPRADWVKPRLKGYRLVNGTYEPIPAATDGSITSRELGIRFALEQTELAMFDVQTGERLLSPEEIARQERHRADEEKKRADEEKQRADEEKQRADQAEHRAMTESAGRKALEDELARLRDAGRKPNGDRRKNGK